MSCLLSGGWVRFQVNMYGPKMLLLQDMMCFWLRQATHKMAKGETCLFGTL